MTTTMIFGKMGAGVKLMRQRKTARDYVQDGLIRHLDGIESGGYGLRSPNDFWYDLKSNDKASMQSGGWTDFGNIKQGNSGLTISNLSTVFDAGMTIECLANQYGRTGEENLLGFNASSMIILVPQTSYNRVICVWSSVIVSVPSIVEGGTGTYLFSLVVKSSATMDIYINGTLVASDKNAGSTPTSDILYIGRSYRSYTSTWLKMNYRVYDRPLTAAEIAANYAIDRERFNLP